MQVLPIKTRVYKQSEDLFSFIIEHLPSLEEETILVITSKIAALAEGRVVRIETDEEKETIIRNESEYAYHHPYGWLSIVNGIMVGSAGLDASNIEGMHYSLLPKNSFTVAEDMQKQLREHYGLNKLGVIVTDSRLMPLRKGTLGAAFGYAGIQALRSYAGTEDIYGRPYERQKANIPDALATAAVFVMGEGKEQQPLATITNAPVTFTNEPQEEREIAVPVKDDIYYFFYKDYNGE